MIWGLLGQGIGDLDLGLTIWLNGSSIYVQALNQKLQAQSKRKPAPSYVKGVLRCFVNCTVQAELLYVQSMFERKTSILCPRLFLYPLKVPGWSQTPLFQLLINGIVPF